MLRFSRFASLRSLSQVVSPETTQSRRGFTLVELLIVITVIGLISTVVLNGYSRISRGFKSTLAIDNLVSELRSLQSLALNTQDTCYGLSSRDGETLELVSVPFVDEFTGCGQPENFTSRSNFTESEGVILSGVNQGVSLIPTVGFWVLFTPPQGEVIVSGNVLSTEVIAVAIKNPQAPDASVITISPSGIVSKPEADA